MLVFSEKITVSQILKFQQQLIEAFLNSTDMSEENKESPIVPVSMDSWVEWFRSVAPHIHSIRGKTIVIDLAGETILQEHFSSLIADISMISAIGAMNRPSLRRTSPGRRANVIEGHRVPIRQRHSGDDRRCACVRQRSRRRSAPGC